jgi:hypothetical protein
MQPSEIGPITRTAGDLPEPGAWGPAMTSGVVETKLLGLSQGRAPVIFQYGGLVDGGVGSRTLWVGLPDDPDRR